MNGYVGLANLLGLKTRNRNFMVHSWTEYNTCNGLQHKEKYYIVRVDNVI